MQKLFKWITGAVLLALLTACGAAQDTQTIQVKDAWVRAMSVQMGVEPATPQGEADHAAEMNMSFSSAAYMRISNRGKKADRLLRASTPVAETVGLHETTLNGDVMSMQPVNYIEIPANGQVELKPGGLHLMLAGLKQDLNPGDRVPLQLVFENAGTIKIEAEVRAP